MVPGKKEEVISMSENNKLQVAGNVHYLSGPIQIPNKKNPSQPYTKSILVLNVPATSEKGQPQFVPFEAFGNTSSCFDGLVMGSFVTVHFNLGGTQGTPDPNTSQPRFWNKNSAWKVDSPHQQQNNQPQQNFNQPSQQHNQQNHNGGYQQQQQQGGGNQFPQGNNQMQQQPYPQGPPSPSQQNSFNNQQQNSHNGPQQPKPPVSAFQAPPEGPSYTNDMEQDIPF